MGVGSAVSPSQVEYFPCTPWASRRGPLGATTPPNFAAPPTPWSCSTSRVLCFVGALCMRGLFRCNGGGVRLLSRSHAYSNNVYNTAQMTTVRTATLVLLRFVVCCDILGVFFRLKIYALGSKGRCA